MNYLRNLGYICAPVEQWITFPDRNKFGKNIRIKRDCFNFADIVACHADVSGTLYIQTTSAANQAARRNKILASDEAVTVLRSHNKIHVHGWHKVMIGRAARWKVNVFDAVLDNGEIKFVPLLSDDI